MEREVPGGTPLAMQVRRLWPDRDADWAMTEQQWSRRHWAEPE